MSLELVPADVAILDLLRKREALQVDQLATLTGVTKNAVRIRLNRLLAQGLIDRVAVINGPGRPKHDYVLTSAGRRKSGANFGDLAIALWEEIRSIKDAEIRSGLLQRISKRLAEQYADEIVGETLEERLESLSQLFSERKIPFGVELDGELPVLNAFQSLQY